MPEAAAADHDHLELVLRILEAYKREDYEAAFSLFHPRIEWQVGELFGDALAASGIEPSVTGPEGVRRTFREWGQAWETVDFRYEASELVGPLVVSTLSQRVRARASGIELEWPSYGQVWTFRDGLLVRSEFFPSRDAAYEAALAALRRQAIDVIEAVNARDFGAPAFADLVTPDIRFASALEAIEGGVHVGLGGMREWGRQADAAWRGFRAEVEDVRPVPDGRVVLVLHVTGVAHGSGVPLDTRTGQVWTFRGSRIARNDSFSEPRAAFAAAGAEE